MEYNDSDRIARFQRSTKAALSVLLFECLSVGFCRTQSQIYFSFLAGLVEERADESQRAFQPQERVCGGISVRCCFRVELTLNEI